MKQSLSWLVFLALIPGNADAQIIPDSSLGAENSTVNSNGNRDTINGGAIRNANLFHSFQEFNVGTGREAYFTNPDGIDNIFSRVTGNNPSGINGVLGVLGNANLFLINPNGIIFGRNASLDVNGSFFATTADSVVFGNGFEFSAANPNQPPLLTIDIPIGLRFRDNPAPIFNISTANNVGLQVQPEETLGLIGGFIGIGLLNSTLDGKIISPGSNLELGGLIATGIVTIEDDLKLSFPEGINRANVFLLNGAEVNVASDGGGAIIINGGNIALFGGSRLVGGIAEGLGNIDVRAGDITLNATDAVILTNESSIENPVNRNAVGNSGDINLSADSLTLDNGSFVSASTFGLGNGGDININVAEAVELDGVTETSITRFASVVSAGARGDGGEININAGSLTVSNGALINTRISFAEDGNPGGIGNGGDINIDVKEAVTVAGFTQVNNDSEPIFSTVTTSPGSGAKGNGGNIDIKARSLFLENGGFLSTTIFGQGSPGDINIDVQENVTITNTGGIFSNLGKDAIVPEGERSTVTIKAGSLSITDTNSVINTSSLGIGDAGNIDIAVESFSLADGSFLGSSISGSGDAGNITVSADESISLTNKSSILSSLASDGVGQGGQINVTAKSVSLSEESFISTSTLSENEQSNSGNIEVNVTESLNLTGDSFLSSETGGKGDAGNITVNGEGANILIQGGENSNSQISTSNNTTGNAGDINITGRSLFLENGGFLRSNTLGQGNAGNITIEVDESIVLANVSSISSVVSSDAVGQGGQINLTAKSVSLSETSWISARTSSQDEQSNGGNIEVNVAESLDLTGGSFISSFTNGKGDAGNITINGEGADILIEGIGSLGESGNINSSTGGSGNAGDINITGQSLALQDAGALDSNTVGQGLPGNITLDIEKALTLTNQGRIANIVNENAIVPEGENSTIQINAGSLFIGDNSFINSSSFGIANAGDIVININDGLDVVDGNISTFLGEKEGKAGDITIKAGYLSLNDGAFFGTVTIGQGDSGRVSITTDDAVTLSGLGTSIRSDVGVSGKGNGGNIDINARELTLANGANIDSSTSGQGDSGVVSITTDDAITLSGAGTSIRSDVGVSGKGNGGNIDIKARELSLADGAILDSSTFGQGNSGRVSITTEEAVTLSGVGTGLRSIVGTNGIGSAGNIDIKARELSLADGVVLNSSTFGQGDSGVVSITTDDTITLSGAGTTIFNNVEAGGVGNSQGIFIEAESLSLTEGAQIQTLVRRASEANSSGAGNAGNIEINVRDVVNFSGFGVNSAGGTSTSQANSVLEIGAEGKAGNITIKARSLSLNDGGALNTSSFGIGNAGNITLEIQDTVNISGFALNSDGTSLLSSQVSSTLAAEAEGKAGDIKIEAHSLLLEDGGRINNTTFGVGDAGNLDIAVDESISLFGSSIISNSVGQEGEGNAGNLDITAKSLTLRAGSQINSVVFREAFNIPGGIGEGGNITINATDFIDLAGVGTVQLNIPDTSGDPSNTTGLIPTAGFSSGILTATQRGASGEAGTIAITTDAFRIAEGAVIDNSTTNDSNAGTISINANTLEAVGGGQIITATRGNGNAGDIKLNIADTVSISGTDPNFAARLERAEEFGEIQGGDNIVTNQGAASGIFANTSADSTGDGGNILIGIFKQEQENLILDPNQFTPEITLTEEAEIFASTLGEGNAQNITLNTAQLTIDRGASLSAFTQNIGNAGNITVNAPQTVRLNDNSQLTVETSSQGKPGNITITTPNLTIGKDAQISATATETSTNTEGNSSITINTSNLDLTGKLGIFAETQGVAPAGTLNIQPDNNQANLDIQFRDTAIISASTSGSGRGGDINLTAPEIINLSGKGRIAVETTGSGNAGSINITTEQINVSNQTKISASTSGTGSAGSITLLGTESVFLDHSFITTIINAGADIDEAAQPSNITITTADLSLNNGTQITASTSGIGNGGNININATENLSLNNTIVSSGVETEAVGKAGNINLTAPLIVLKDGSIISTSTEGKGDGGTVRVIAEEDILFITSTATSAVGKDGVGNAGIVEIKSKEINLTNAELSSSTAGFGNANSVIIEATKNLSLNNTTVSSAVETGAVGNAGNVNLNAPSIAVTNKSLISSSTQGEGNAGGVTVIAKDLIISDGASISASNFPSNQTIANETIEEFGNVNIEANNITLKNGVINAETQAGDNGNITLKVAEDIILRDNSLISARASKDATGGNIDIDARYIIAYPSKPQGNDIIASAEQGAGGEINLTAETLFGIEEKKATGNNGTNDIDASSQFGLSGTVNIRQPDVNPASGLVELTEEVVDAARLIAQNACTQTVNSEFVDIGKGGLPSTPSDVLTKENIEVGLIAPVTARNGEIARQEAEKETQDLYPVKKARKPPAQGWIWREDGTVELVAYNPDEAGEQRTWDHHKGCQL